MAATAREFGVGDKSVAFWLRLADEHGPDWPRTEADEEFHRTTEYRAHKARSVDETRRRRYLGLGPRVVDATGTRRRLQALMRMGWTTAELAARGGWNTPEAVQMIARRDMVNHANRDRVARLYDALAMIPGPSSLTAQRAARAGWAPPLAWDDIDNDPEPYHEELPQQVRRVLARGEQPAAFRVEDAEWMADADETLSGACRRLGITQDSLWKACDREGRLDVYDRLALREPDGEMRTNVRQTKRRGVAA
jgi:hypothetical protein